MELAVSRQAIAVLRDSDKLLPLDREQPVTLVNTALRSACEHLGATSGIGPNQTDAAFDLFAAAIRSRSREVTILGAEDILKGSRPVPGNAVIAVTENHPLPGMDFDQSAKFEVLKALDSSLNGRFMVFALRDPYELEQLAFIRNYVCAFSSRACAADAAAEILFGEAYASGDSPVSVAGTNVHAR